MDPQEKAIYHKELGKNFNVFLKFIILTILTKLYSLFVEMQIQERKQLQEMEKQNDLYIIRQQVVLK